MPCKKRITTISNQHCIQNPIIIPCIYRSKTTLVSVHSMKLFFKYIYTIMKSITRVTNGENLLLKFYVDQSGSWIGNSPEGSFGQNNGRAWNRRCRFQLKSVINDPDLNSLLRFTGSGLRGAYASHQVLPPARCPVIPYPISSRRE